MRACVRTHTCMNWPKQPTFARERDDCSQPRSPVPHGHWVGAQIHHAPPSGTHPFPTPPGPTPLWPSNPTPPSLNPLPHLPTSPPRTRGPGGGLWPQLPHRAHRGHRQGAGRVRRGGQPGGGGPGLAARWAQCVALAGAQGGGRGEGGGRIQRGPWHGACAPVGKRVLPVRVVAVVRWAGKGCRRGHGLAPWGAPPCGGHAASHSDAALSTGPQLTK